MAQVKTVLTYEDYAALPSEGARYEIHDGELSVSPTPTFRHQLIVARLLVALRSHAFAHDLGEVVPSPITIVLSDTNVLEPDIVFIAKDRMRLVAPRGTIDGPPTLAIEVLAPSTARNDRGKKKQLFERFGVPWYWIVDADACCIDVAALVSGSYGAPERRSESLVDLPPFAGLTINAAALWQ
jgi:Uma2 family endonuclease